MGVLAQNLLERDSAAVALFATLSRAQDGKMATTLVLGEAGLGKTALSKRPSRRHASSGSRWPAPKALRPRWRCRLATSHSCFLTRGQRTCRASLPPSPRRNGPPSLGNAYAAGPSNGAGARSSSPSTTSTGLTAIR